MIGIVQLLQEGGAFALASLVVAAVGALGSAVYLLVIGALRWRAPTTLAWLPLGALGFVAAAAAWYGSSQVDQAVVLGEPAFRATLAAAGIASMIGTGTFAAAGASMVALTCAFAAGAAALIRPGPEPRLDLRSAGLGLLGGVLGVVLAVGGTAAMVGGAWLEVGMALFAVPAIALFVSLAPWMATARIASEDHGQIARVVGLRLFAACSAALGVGLAGEVFRMFGVQQTFQAVAMAAPEMKGLLVATGLDVAGLAAMLGWLFALVPLGVGTFGATPHLGRADPWTAVDVTIGGLLGAALLGGVLYLPFGLREATASLAALFGA